MSYDSFIMLSPHAGAEAMCFLRLLREFWPENNQSNIHFSRGDDPTSSNHRIIYSAEDIRSLADEVLTSDLALIVQLETFLPSGRRAFLEARLHGETYRRGLECDALGSIVLRFDYEDLYRPIQKYLGFVDIIDEQIQHAYIRGKTGVKECANIIRLDLEDIFLRSCGLKEDVALESHAIAATTSCEYRWPTPGQSGLIYYKDRKEFIRDVGRMYASFHWGNTVHSTLGKNYSFDDLAHSIKKDWEFPLSECRVQKEDLPLCSPHRLLEEQILEFYSKISKDVAAFMFNNAEHLIEKMEDLIIHPEAKITGYDFDERGVVWSSGVFLSGTWRAYSQLIERASRLLSG